MLRGITGLRSSIILNKRRSIGSAQNLHIFRCNAMAISTIGCKVFTVITEVITNFYNYPIPVAIRFLAI